MGRQAFMARLVLVSHFFRLPQYYRFKENIFQQVKNSVFRFFSSCTFWVVGEAFIWSYHSSCPHMI